MENIKPKYRDIMDALHTLKEIQFALDNEYEENGGEVTESTCYKEEMKEAILYMLDNGGVDELARLLNSAKAKDEQYKEEQKFIKRQQEQNEKFQDDLLEGINVAMEFLGQDKMKGKLGYSFTQHIASSTKPDNKLIKDLFYKDVERAIREAKVCPDHITFTLSASSSKLKAGEDMPDYFTTTSRARATFRKPIQKKDKPEDVFANNNFDDNI